MADTDCTCRHCGKGFRKGAKAKFAHYCAPECRAEAKRVKRKARGYPLAPLRAMTCVGCQQGYSTRHPEQRFCNKKCAWTTKRKPRLLIEAEVAALRRIARYIEKPALFRCACKGCGQPIIARHNGGLPKQKCAACLTEGRLRCKRVARSRRRAIERGSQADRIDPIAVFERDKWKCHLCGCKTPRAKRGTYHPRAPELDHVVTLADGGTHTWGNVACACRACNAAKGARSLGQMGLALVA